MLGGGYVHINGGYQAKRYFAPIDIQEAKESPMCKTVFGPFAAYDRADAINKIIQMEHENT